MSEGIKKAFELGELSPEQQADIDKYTTFGDEWKASAKRARLASSWVKAHLTEVSRDGAIVGRCCSSGNTVYRRTDGQPITQDDLDAVAALSVGQVNKALGKAGDDTLTHHWLIDSSD